MKKIIALIIVLGLSSLSFAQEPVSIRSNSLANIILDDWDLIYDPIDLKFIDGTHFFTNLADFNSYYHDNNGDWEEQNEPFLTELPLGISFQNPFSKNLKHSLLLRLRESKESENANAGSGEYEKNSMDYCDVDGDGLYDNRRFFSGKYNNFDINKRIGFVFNNNFIWGDKTVGFKFAYDKQKTEKDEAKNDMGIDNFGGIWWYWPYSWGVDAGDYGFERTETNYLMEEEYSDYNFSEKGDFLTTNETSNIRFNLAFMKQFEFKGIKPELRFDFMHQRLVKGKEETNDYYSGEYSELGVPDSLDNQDFASGNITDAYKMIIDESGDKNQIGFSIKNVFNQQKARKNDGFWELGISFGLSSGDFESSDDIQLNTEQSMAYADTSNIDWNQEDSNHIWINDIGDYNGSNINLYGKFNIPFKEIINFGFGTFYNYNVVEKETDYIEETDNRTEYTEGELFDDENDFIVTETGKLTADRTFEKQIYSFRIPVGLEFRMPRKDITEHDAFGLRNFSFRIGTTFISTKTIINDKKQVTDSYPFTTITEYGDGEIEVDFNDNFYQSTSEHSENIVGTKRFSGGIGYNHSENLQIDIGGYIDDEGKDFLLGISFSIKL